MEQPMQNRNAQTNDAIQKLPMRIDFFMESLIVEMLSDRLPSCKAKRTIFVHGM